MNGCQFSVRMKGAAATMKSKTTATLMITITELKRADSLMPTTRMAVTNRVISTAGRLMIAPVNWTCRCASLHTRGELVQVAGIFHPVTLATKATT